MDIDVAIEVLLQEKGCCDSLNSKSCEHIKDCIECKYCTDLDDLSEAIQTVVNVVSKVREVKMKGVSSPNG